MSQYTKSTNFATKDNLPTGDPLKIVKGTEIDTEFNNISTAISTKTDNASAAITGGLITGITDLAIADGGTGASTATAAINNLLPSQTSNANKYLQTDGTNVSWDAISINTGDITGTLAVANGGTGVTSSTGTGSVVLSNSPTLVTPSLGAATVSTLDVSGNVTLSGGTANTIPYLNGSKVVTTGTELYFNGTNLGVGASASYRVDLGSATSDDAAVGIRIGRGGSSTTWSLIDNVGGSGNYRQYSSGTPTLRWLTSTDGSSWSEQMRLNATGLGVGNNNPAAKLDVTGSALVSGSVTAASFAGALNGTVGATTASTGAFTTLAASGAVTLSGGTANGVTYLNGSKVLTSGSALTFDGTTLATTASVQTAIDFIGTGGRLALYRSAGASYIDWASAQDLVWRTVTSSGGSGPSELMRLTSTGLGIGTSSPAVKLHIESASAESFRIGYSSTKTSRLGTTSAGDLQVFAYDSAVGYKNILLAVDAGTSAGNVGIGTSSPTHKVEASTSGNTYIGITSTTDNNAANRYKNSQRDWLVGALGGASGAFGIYDITGSTQRLTLDTSGNLGLGVTPSAWGAGYKAFQNGIFSLASDGTNNDLTANRYINFGGTSTYVSNGFATMLRQESGTFKFFTAASGTAGNAISFTQAMTLDASGNLLVGTTNTNPIGSNIPGFVVSSSGNISASRNGGASLDLNRYTSDGSIARFNRSSVQVGSIDVTTTATTYSTSSDYRLKNTIAPMTGALAKVALLKPVTYKWNADGSDGEGFIAHELAEVVPQCVTGEKDAVDEDGNPKYQGIDTSFLVATLTAAIQELKAEFDAYKASHP